MGELWRVAIGLTGVSGVVAFVLWSLYKEWIRAPALLKELTKAQKYSLLKLFLMLTFVFAIAGLILGGFNSFLNNKVALQEPNIDPVVFSIGELRSSLAGKLDYGLKVLKTLPSKGLSESELELAGELLSEYIILMNKADEALKKQELNNYDKYKSQLYNLLYSATYSDLIRKHFPLLRIDYMARGSDDIIAETDCWKYNQYTAELELVCS